MKFSYSWLKQHVEIKQTPEKLAELLSEHAFEVEAGGSSTTFDGIIVAKVTKVEKHPNADRLRVIELTDGSKTIYPVVCGAWNFEAGAIVPLALPGALIPHDNHDPEGKSFTLGKAKIRGIESQGMICSAKELGLGKDSDGIMLLDDSLTLGSNFSVNSGDAKDLLDISIPANRPDLLGYLGIAREISAINNQPLKFAFKKNRVTKLKPKLLQVSIAAPKLCVKYSAARLVNVKVGDSPKYIKERLESVGLRSINNVVDITNYVMLELGQPMHAFDSGKVVGGIKVRHAFVNEKITTLDGVARTLDSETLVIADSKKAIAIAGIMGGLETSVTPNTTEIILEAANFNSVSVRKAYKRLGLRTDSASRFERSLPPDFVEQALEYACELLEKHASAKTIEHASSGSFKPQINKVTLNPEEVNKLLGFEVKVSEQKRILTQFGFKVSSKGKGMIVAIPEYRPDVKIWQDLAEEIARYIGLNNIPMMQPFSQVSSVPTNTILSSADDIRNILTGLGFEECYTYSFVSESALTQLGISKDSAVEISNPIVSELKYMRSSIRMNYSELVKQNSRYASEQNMFEIGNVYSWQKGQIEEHTNLFMLRFSKEKSEFEFLGSLRELFKRLNITLGIKQESVQNALIFANSKQVGELVTGKDAVSWISAEIKLGELIKQIKPKSYQNISKYPSKQLDVAVLVNEDTPWEVIRSEILSIKDALLKQVELIEVYQGGKIGPGKKSFTFRLVYQSMERTLTDDEVEKIQAQILRNLKANLNVEARN